MDETAALGWSWSNVQNGIQWLDVNVVSTDSGLSQAQPWSVNVCVNGFRNERVPPAITECERVCVKQSL